MVHLRDPKILIFVYSTFCYTHLSLNTRVWRDSLDVTIQSFLTENCMIFHYF